MNHSAPDLSGRTSVVTGATSGIGLVVARELAARGSTIVVVGRDAGRCRAAVESIRSATGNPLVESVCGDLSRQSEVRLVAQDIAARHDRLHVLVNNAGALFALRRESDEGIEMTLALNHLAPFLLTDLLLPRLTAGAPSRIITVSSDSHELVKAFDVDDPQAASARRGYGAGELKTTLFALLMPRHHPGLVQYAHTKLANILFTTELARRLEGTGVTACAVHPGFVATGFTDGNGTYGRLMRFWSRLFAMSPEEGARGIVHLATSPDVESVTGAYFVKGRPARPSAAALDPEGARRLWALSEGMVRR